MLYPLSYGGGGHFHLKGMSAPMRSSDRCFVAPPAGTTNTEVSAMALTRTAPVVGIDRMVRNVRHGRFERTLSLLTGVGAAVSAAEIYFEHDKASFGNRLMYLPVALGPVGLAAGVAGFANRTAAKTALPLVSTLIVFNGLQGTYLHARGISQRPGGWRLTRYNMEMGPPLLAPLMVTMVGGMGLLAAVLRREDF
jgi:hypothetical protein